MTAVTRPCSFPEPTNGLDPGSPLCQLYSFQSNQLEKDGFRLSWHRVFADPEAVSCLERVFDGEERWHTIGRAKGIVLLLVVHTVEEENTAVQAPLKACKKEKYDLKRRLGALDQGIQTTGR